MCSSLYDVIMEAFRSEETSNDHLYDKYLLNHIEDNDEHREYFTIHRNTYKILYINLLHIWMKISMMKIFVNTSWLKNTRN